MFGTQHQIRDEQHKWTSRRVPKLIATGHQNEGLLEADLLCRRLNPVIADERQREGIEHLLRSYFSMFHHVRNQGAHAVGGSPFHPIWPEHAETGIGVNTLARVTLIDEFTHLVDAASLDQYPDAMTKMVQLQRQARHNLETFWTPQSKAHMHPLTWNAMFGEEKEQPNQTFLATIRDLLSKETHTKHGWAVPDGCQLEDNDNLACALAFWLECTPEFATRRFVPVKLYTPFVEWCDATSDAQSLVKQLHFACRSGLFESRFCGSFFGCTANY
eukprot:GHVR01189206.1.p1 GENE.GHVR01189206.1~~GHVR01189206.1.p1  ORF type:complete len:273 (+),score=25.04 GHVR01189206.1:110-928(+)